ncbi:MAG: FecR domain-containing protein [Gammaproteobacteria bacterium]
MALVQNAPAEEWVYTVRPGDNPWSLSQKYALDMQYWPEIVRRNGISDATHIPPGTRLRIPLEWLKHDVRPIPVRALDVRGDAKVRPAAGGPATAIQNGAALQPGDEVTTGATGNVLLEFIDGSQVRVLADSTVVLDTLDVYVKSTTVDTRLHLQRGRLDQTVTPRQETGTRFEIRTPAAVAAVRGTQFRVSADSAATMRVEVDGGKVNVGNASGNQAIAANFGTIASPSAGPQRAIALLPAPDVSGIANSATQFDLQWPALPGAVEYRVQVLKNTQKRLGLLVFNQGRLVRTEQANVKNILALLADKKVSTPAFKLPNVANGQYRVRIRGIDSQGLEGLSADHDILLLATTGPAKP